MNKKSELSLPERMALMALLGGTAYAGARTLKDLTPKDKEQKEELSISIPAARFNESKMASEKSTQPVNDKPWIGTGAGLRNAAKIVGPAVALPAGFLLAKKIDELYQDHKLEKEENKVERQYLEALSKVSSLNTPFVDRFCEGMLQEIKKQAENNYDDALAYAAGRGMNSVKGVVKEVTEPFRERVFDPTMWVLAGLGGAGVYGLDRYQAMKKKEEENRRKLPSRVNLQLA